MAAIGAITVDIMRGLPDPYGDELEQIERTGVDGSAFFIKGARAAPRQIETVETFVKASTTPQAKLQAYLALKGTIVTLTDAHGTSWTNILIADVSATVSPVAAVSGGTANATAMISASWTVKQVGA